MPEQGRPDDNAHCINPPAVEKVTWSGFEAKWPAAYDLIRQATMDAKQQQMMLAVDQKNQDVDTVTKTWIDSHDAVWKPWVEAATK